MLITSTSNNRIKEIRKLKDKKYSNSKKLFVIEGENLIDEAIKNNLLVELYVLEGTEIKYNFNYDVVTYEVMKTLSDLKSVPRLIGVSKYIEKNELGNRIVILDGVQDPGNLGTIVRNSVAFGADTIVLSKETVSLYNEKVLRSTGGMIYNINVVTGDPEDIINKIKDKDIKVIGTSLRKSKSLEEFERLDKYAIIFGNEGNGVSSKILDCCDDIVRIDMDNKCESLNVGVSTGIILYHLYKR